MTTLEERITLTAKMFANIKDKDGSELDVVNKEVRIVFEEGVCPKTDGKTIYLPTNMNEDRLWELLGSLLHESLHIRFTDINSLHDDFIENPSLFHVLNALEDMRINWKALQIFPKTKLFFHALYFYLAKSKKEDLLAEPISFQIIKTLLLSNEDFPTYSPKAEELIKKHNLMRFRTIARKAKCIQELEQPARDLFKILNDICGEELNDLGDGELAEMLKNLKGDLEKQINDKGADIQGLQKELRDLQDKYEELQKEWKRQHRRMATNKTRSTNLNREADDLDREADDEFKKGHKKKSNELRDKANHKRKLSDAASYRGDEASVKLSENEQEQIDVRAKMDFLEKLINDLKDSLRELKDHLDDLLKNGAESIPAGFGYSPVNINGLDALDMDDLVYENSYVLPKSLQATIREVFLKKKEDREIEDEGRRLNRSNLYRIVTDNQRLFETPVQPYDKTKVAFLLDASGSMHGHRAQLVNTAFAYLYNSLHEVLVSEQLDVQIGVWSFDHDLYDLKNFTEEKTGEQIISGYRPMGGTQILRNLTKVITKMEEDGQNEKRVVILLTDAEVGDGELLQIKNSVSFEDTKVVFIGVELNQYSWGRESSIAKELFMDNIEQDSNVVDILTQALVRNL